MRVASGVELAQVAAGHSETGPSKGDRRFGERAWQDNWLLRRVMQGYLATCEIADRLISDAGLDWRTERQARFAASNLLDALAPTNFRWSNPAVLKESIDAGGANLVRGGRRFVRDMTRPPHLPASVDVTKFEVGGNLAVTPGSVVLRTDVFELIQYRPANKQVHEVPLLFVPPTINKYLHPRHRAGAQHGGVAARRTAAGVHHLVAQPRRRAGPFRPRHLRTGGARGARRGGRDHPPTRRQRQRGLLRWNHHRLRTGAISPRSASRTSSGR
jgi:Poly-beta-hydroxybutyrate polymerase (PhaC) N-terminus